MTQNRDTTLYLSTYTNITFWRYAQTFKKFKGFIKTTKQLVISFFINLCLTFPNSE